MRRKREKDVIMAFFSAENPGVISGMSTGREMYKTAMLANRPSIMTLMIVDMCLVCSSLLFLYLMKNGINVVVSAPVMSISNTRSGIRNDAKKISSSSFVK
jgi:hypothetical protein